MLKYYYVYIIVIYDGMYLRNMVNILYYGGHYIGSWWACLEMDIYIYIHKGSVEEKGTYGAAGVLWDCLRRSEQVFSDGVHWIVVMEIDNGCVSKWEKDVLPMFSFFWQHFFFILDFFVFSKTFLFRPDDCRMKTASNQWSQISFRAII